jgi:arsenate reductase-like glutaredoxin family protein
VAGPVVNATKERRGRDEALQLAKMVERVVVARGKKVVTFDMKNAPPDDDTLAAHLLGPTGNLKAPTLRKGNTLLVGFGEEAYRQVLGG